MRSGEHRRQRLSNRKNPDGRLPFHGGSPDYNLRTEIDRLFIACPVIRVVKELARSYLTISKDLGPAMNLAKAIYRRWAIPCAREHVNEHRYRSDWLGKIQEAGVRRRA